VDEWDDKRIQQYAAQNGTKFEYTSPGSPWANGVSEALIRSLKLTLQKTIPPHMDLTFTELQTYLMEVCSILNERPISLGHQGASGSDFEAETNSYVCPQQLLLGRATVSIPQGPFKPVPATHRERFSAIQTLVTEWWHKWNTLYLPSLIYQTKWHKESRKVKIGDIVHVRDINPVRGDWKIGEIIEIKANEENIPRNVLIRYKTAKKPTNRSYTASQFRTQWRDVKNLSLILPIEERSE
jgi:hypothetical protein